MTRNLGPRRGPADTQIVRARYRAEDYTVRPEELSELARWQGSRDGYDALAEMNDGPFGNYAELDRIEHDDKTWVVLRHALYDWCLEVEHTRLSLGEIRVVSPERAYRYALAVDAKRTQRVVYEAADAGPLQPSPDLVLTYASGLESSPSDRRGKSVLTLRGEGSAQLENRWYTKQRAYRGSVAPAVVEAILGALLAAGFPAVPPHPLPSGSSLRTLHLRNGGHEAYTMPIEWHAGGAILGYRAAFRILDSIVRQVSLHELQATDDFEPGLVHDAVKERDEIVPLA